MKYLVPFLTTITLFSIQHIYPSTKGDILNAIIDYDLITFRKLLSEDPSYQAIYATDLKRNTLLHEACKLLQEGEQDQISIERLTTIIKELLATERFDVNEKNEDGYTPFYYTCQKGNFSLITLFLEKRADPNIQITAVDPNRQNVVDHVGDSPFHCICSNISKITNPEKRIELIEKFFEDRTIIKIIDGEEETISLKADPNIQNEKGDTPYHLVANIPDLIQLFSTHGARGDIPNGNGITVNQLTLNYEGYHGLINNKNISWESIENLPNWSTYANNRLPTFIKKVFRYYQSGKLPDDLFIDGGSNIIAMITIHDLKDEKNGAYHDHQNDEFKGIMSFAQNYVDSYNQRRDAKKERINQNSQMNQVQRKEEIDKQEMKKKLLHLIPFSWENDIKASATKLAEFLNIYYPNSRFIFLAKGRGCDVASLTSQGLTYLQEANEKIAAENQGKPKIQERLYKGRIKLLLYIAPPHSLHKYNS